MRIEFKFIVFLCIQVMEEIVVMEENIVLLKRVIVDKEVFMKVT